MGGTGKSEVIKAFMFFVRTIPRMVDWKYDQDVIKITALTGAAACEIPNGRTLHSQACLNLKGKINQDHRSLWKSTKMLIIDEVSFLSCDLIEKLDKHMRSLKEVSDEMFGGIHVVFVDDFFQLLPVGAQKALFQQNTVQFGAINKAIFLNKSH